MGVNAKRGTVVAEEQQVPLIRQYSYQGVYTSSSQQHFVALPVFWMWTTQECSISPGLPNCFTPITIKLVGHLLCHPKYNKTSLPRNTGQSVRPRTFRYKMTRRLLSISSRKNTSRNCPQLNKWILSLPFLPPPIPSPPTTSQVVRATTLIASSLECVHLRVFYLVILFVGRYTLYTVFEFVLTEFIFLRRTASESYGS